MILESSRQAMEFVADPLGGLGHNKMVGLVTKNGWVLVCCLQMCWSVNLKLVGLAAEAE